MHRDIFLIGWLKVAVCDWLIQRVCPAVFGADSDAIPKKCVWSDLKYVINQDGVVEWVE